MILSNTFKTTSFVSDYMSTQNQKNYLDFLFKSVTSEYQFCRINLFQLFVLGVTKKALLSCNLSMSMVGFGVTLKEIKDFACSFWKYFCF